MIAPASQQDEVMAENIEPAQADTDNKLLRKILLATLAGGGGGGGGGNVVVTNTPNVSVVNTPAVTVTSGSISISNTPAVTISGSPAVTIADGADVTQGAKADIAAVAPGSGSWTINSLLKGIFARFDSALINTVANGADQTQGARADAAATDSTSAWSVVSILKGIWAKVAGTLTVSVSNSPAVTVTSGSISISNTPAVTITSGTTAVTVADGADVAEGAKADAAVTNPASSASVIALLKGILTNTGSGGSIAGNVGGFTAVIKTAPTITASVYSAGNSVGGKQTLSNAVRTAGTGILESLTLLDRANQKAAMTVYIFDADPTNATLADHGAFVFSTDDLKVIAQISIAAGDYVTTNSKAIAVESGLSIALKTASGTTLYAVAVTSGTPTYASTSDLQFVYGILQD
jgi:hypothetical protein